MGLFSKTRTGTMRNVRGGLLFEWEIPNVSTYSNGTTLDSALESHRLGARFHFHLSFAENGDVGFYIHFKQPPIPKYSYFLRNHKNEIMRQQTAHTIPDDTERCGHWNVCSRKDLMDFIHGGPDTLTIVFSFDDDAIIMLDAAGKPPKIIMDAFTNGELQILSAEENGVISSQLNPPPPKTVQVLWKIPCLHEKCLWPLTSEGFSIGGAHLVARVDVRRKSTTACIAPYDYQDIDAVIFFLFSRKGDIPSHSIELVDGETEPMCNMPYAGIGPKPAGLAQALLVDRSVVDDHFKNTPVVVTTAGVIGNHLYVRFTFVQENPLDFLNQKNGVSSPHSAPSAKQPSAKPKKMKYTQMEKES